MRVNIFAMEEEKYIVRYLVIRFSSIGDIVLTTPVVRCLKQQVENAEIHFLTKPANAGILEPNPYIDEVHTLKNTYAETIDELREIPFDYVIDLQKNLRSKRIINKLKILDFSFPKLNWQKWLATSFLKINKLPDIHIVDRYLTATRLFDVHNDGKGLDYFIPENEEVDTKSAFGLDANTYVAYAIGGQHATKRMPRELISQICGKLNARVVLLGGNSDVEAAEYICAENENSINLCGMLSLSQSASVVRQAKYVITHDTGLMHIAAAFKKDIVSIWGNTIPQFGMTPYMAGDKSKIFEVKDLKCRPCSKLGYEKCPRKHFRCMNDQNIDEIVEYCNKI